MDFRIADSFTDSLGRLAGPTRRRSPTRRFLAPAGQRLVRCVRFAKHLSLHLFQRIHLTRLTSARARRMIFRNAGSGLRDRDSRSTSLSDTRAATGFLFEVRTMDSDPKLAA
jgi:hypothetical protein